MGELTVGAIISGGFSKGFKNVLPLVANMILWLLTIWIPYLNIGTTIGMATIALKMNEGNVISGVEIFKPIYRKRMGEFFLTYILVYLGVAVGLIFMVIPGFVLAISWSLALLLVVGKELNPLEAMNESNRLTYGKKWTIFGGELVLTIIVLILPVVSAIIGQATHGFVSALFFVIAVILYLIAASILVGAQATIYEKLVK